MSTEADWLHAGFSVGDGLFEGEEAVLHVIERIVAPLDLRVDATSPWVNAPLPDGSRVQTRLPRIPLSVTARSP
jgi:Flp pilus assembly CpaF family ATPase